MPEQNKHISKSTKSLSGKLTIVENQRSGSELQQEALSIGDVPLTGKMENSVSDCFKEVGTELDASNYPGPCDKLSIKSGVSMAASSNSVFNFLFNFGLY